MWNSWSLNWITLDCAGVPNQVASECFFPFLSKKIHQTVSSLISTLQALVHYSTLDPPSG